ncbi:hypothetical protein [Bradyrhizobium sp. HKCCYLR20261]|uniref:hypothetical protein n=1 Tax=Bradyrhizobium sp. HKCCYLR20261 TaxID=3420760 RepID=UPI003EC15204
MRLQPFWSFAGLSAQDRPGLPVEAGAAPQTPSAATTRSLPRLWLVLALLLAIVLATPFLLVDVPPVLDYPNHLARLFVLAHPDDPVLSQMYQPNWRILPNLGMDLIGTALLRFTDVHVGGRILLALSLFAPLAGVVAYHRAAFGRLSLWPLAAGVIAYNGVFLLGFMNFQMSLGLALGGAAGWLMLRRRGDWWLLTAWGMLAATATFLSHILGLVFFAVIVGAAEAERLWRLRGSTGLPRELGLTAAALALSVMPALTLYALGPLGEAGARPGPWLWQPKLWWIFAPFMTTSTGLTLLTACAVLSLLVLIRRQIELAPGLLLALCALLLGFVIAPAKAINGVYIDFRIATMMGLLLFAGLQPRLSRRGAAYAGLVLGALTILRCVDVGAGWIDHRDDLAELRAAIAQVQPGTRVLATNGELEGIDDGSRTERTLPGVHRVDTHLAALLVIERRAFWPLMFAHPAMQPVIVRAPFDQLAEPLGEPVEWRWLRAPDLVSDGPPPSYLDRWRSDFDDVLLIGPPRRQPTVAGLSPLYRGSYVQLYRIERAPGADLTSKSPEPVRSRSSS